MAPEVKRFLRAWSIVALAVLVIGPLAGLCTASLSGIDGGPDATLLTSQSAAAGVLVAAGVTALTLAAGYAGARWASANVGLFAAGVVLAWAAARTGRVDIIIAVQRASPLPRFILEGLLVALVALCVVEVLRRASRDTQREPPIGRTTWALAAGLVGAGLTAWFIAVEPLKGQVIAAACGAGIMGSAIARMVLMDIPPRTVLALPAILAIAGPLATTVMADDAVAASIDGSLFRLGYIAPLDWLAGAMIGIPIGMAWTESVVEQHADP